MTIKRHRGDRHIGHGGHRGSLAPGREPARPHAVAGRGRHCRRRRAGIIIGDAGRALAQTPKRGGRIKVASQTSSTADTVDPAKQNNQTDYTRCFTFYNGVTRLDASLAPQLELAEAIESDSSATVWTIKLRRDVKFHDGTPLTADDVVFSLARHKDPATGSAAKALAAPMKEITASGKHEVKITLESPNADLPVVLGTPHFLIIKNGTSSFTTAIGTGPYRCQEFQPGIKSIGVRNTEYFKPGQPYLDEIELFGIPDQTARLNALLSGDVQIAAAISPQLAKRVQASPGYAVFETKAGGYNDLVIRQDSDLGKNQDLVLALKYLLNREQMRSAVFQGYAVLANDQPIDPTNRFYFPGLKQRPFDPEKAKFHLQRSGIGNTHGPAARHGEQHHARPGGADPAGGPADRPQRRREAHAGRRLLVERLDEAAAHHGQHQSAAQRRRAVHACSSSPIRPGTRAPGRTRSSTSSWSPRAASATRPSASRCTARCRPWCTRTAASACRCSSASSMPIPPS